jgi:8-oxo-dGTP pyrophosphatase MutT (NUDIX family)
MSRAPIIDPQAIPVIGRDGHLSPLTPQQLTAAELRERFSSAPQWPADIAGDACWSARTPSAAAVLVGLVQRDDGLSVLLTRRTEHLREHAGQVSFPGGRVEAADADAIDAALRETEEEIGLPRSHIEVIGQLPVYTTITNFVVTPVVALIEPPFTLALDPFEVAEAFEVPLPFLMTPAHHQRHQIELNGRRRQFLSMPWDGQGSDGVSRRFFIWGATAAMLRNLYGFLSR